MSAAQETTFYIATSIVLSFFIYNLTTLLICLAYRVRVETFQMFFSIKKAFITNFKINNTSFRVGIVPINSHVNIHGMVDNTLNVESIGDTMLISKPKYVQHMVKVLPIIVLSVCFLGLLFIMNSSGSITQNFNSALDSLILLYKTLMGSFSSEEALLQWVNIKGTNSIFILVFSVILLSTILSSAFSLMLNLITFSVPDKLTTIFLAFTALIILVYFAFAYRVIQTAANLYGSFDTLLLILLFILSSYLSAVILFQSLKVLPKQKFV